MTDRELSFEQSSNSLSEADLLLISNTLNEILHGPDAIEEWEFQTRIGLERNYALALLERIVKMLNLKQRS